MASYDKDAVIISLLFNLFAVSTFFKFVMSINELVHQSVASPTRIMTASLLEAHVVTVHNPGGQPSFPFPSILNESVVVAEAREDVHPQHDHRRFESTHFIQP